MLSERMVDETLAVSIIKPQNEIKQKVATVNTDESIDGTTLSIIKVRVPCKDGTTVLLEETLSDNITISNTVYTVNNGLAPVGVVNLSPFAINLKKNNKISTVCFPRAQTGDEYI